MATFLPKDVKKALEHVEIATMDARPRQHKIHSPHEGYGYLVGALEDFWREVNHPHRRDWLLLHGAAIRIAATAVRFAADVAPVEDATWSDVHRRWLEEKPDSRW